MALIALGYSMVYGILKLLNFAHGEVFMIGSYIGYFVLTASGARRAPNIPVALADRPDVRGRDDRIGRARRRHRAVRVPATSGEAGTADRSADQRARRLVLPAADRGHLFGATPKQYNTYSLDGGKLFTSVTIGPFEIQYMQLFVIVVSAVT